MKKIFIRAALLLFILGIIGAVSLSKNTSNNENGDSTLPGSGLVATIYKSATCGCCDIYSNYMDKLGYEVENIITEELSLVKKELGVPIELATCHTTVVEGYVIEGHIPNEAIEKLLLEKPDIKGIGMAGMPSGSPGMPGRKTSDFMIYEITHEGTVGDIFLQI